ncbi:MAG: 4-alpha-glucanotransferase [Pyrinomonadaceae bacterium]
MKFPRGSGILLHITSLPSPFGIGDFGESAFRFVDYLEWAGQKYWQILPLGQTGYGNSPYGCYSAFAGNIYLISPETLVAESLLSEPGAIATGYFERIKDKGERINEDPGSPATDKVDYGKAIDFKNEFLAESFEKFKQTADKTLISEFHRFCDENAFWLEDYSLFQALKLKKDYASWTDWEEGLRLREPDALKTARQGLDDETFAQKFYQFVFFKQWNELKRYANEKGIKIIGDIPIYLTSDSCDVWCNQEQFKLDAEGKPSVVAGVPPDSFSSTGQLWGSPIYDWEKMRSGGFKWWAERIRFNLRMFDIARIDHFIGLTRAWEVPAGDKTAESGQWVSVPGQDLFSTLRYVLGDPALIAEDLGEVTHEVERLRDDFGLPGMRILQFAFGGDSNNLHMPHNFIQNAVVYSGTHDSDTVVGWYKARARKRNNQSGEADYCRRYLQSNGKEIHWDFIRAALSSVADIAIVPMQDVLGLDNSARMNLPGTTDNNWTWRVREDDFSEDIARRLREMTQLFNR